MGERRSAECTSFNNLPLLYHQTGIGIAIKQWELVAEILLYSQPIEEHMHPCMHATLLVCECMYICTHKTCQHACMYNRNTRRSLE